MTRPAVPLSTALARGPLVLDGGLSNELEAQGGDLSGELWTARLLRDEPRRVEAAHAAYVRAGARVLITASYQASFEGFARAGTGRREAAALFRRSVALARAAAGEHPVWVAASVGPYGAVRADGGEYRGRYGLTVRELAAFHRPRIEALAEAEPDVLALETVPDAEEAEALLRAAAGCGVPVWLSYTVEGDRTRAGQPLAEAFEAAAGEEQVAAVGVNCCAPADAGRAVRTAAEVTGKPVVVYPDSGERWAGDRGPRDRPDDRDRGTGGDRDAGAGLPGGAWQGPVSWSADLAGGWAADGARLIGGCCRVGPDLIAGLANEPSLRQR
ncbi:homocysteine S-methyltransferase [Streptomyces marispadix]|uniref:Homocysteine S-methyltransferase n=1 Tax=Streptomyces marispadix TaxID=2922868 RepID=A0ABS9T3P1_9ACTN|nr:homocysteine S-methyltransferase [Streptomyces marispadix]MCH6163151.1 homocysteine S-methyltransferase [Streptomyces marispadix]